MTNSTHNAAPMNLGAAYEAAAAVGVNWLAFSPLSGEDWNLGFETVDLDGLSMFQDSIYRASDLLVQRRNIALQAFESLSSNLGIDSQAEVGSSVVSPASMESTSKASGEPRSFGEYYVDGEEGRLPRVKRRKTAQNWPRTASEPALSEFNLEMAQSDAIQDDTRGGGIEIFKATDADYAATYTLFKSTCLRPEYFPPFKSAFFPNALVFDHLVSLYWLHFSSILPFLHGTLVQESGFRSLLVLAMATIGSHYFECDENNRLVISMHEFLRRVLHLKADTMRREPGGEVAFIQTSILNCIGMFYCGDDRLYDYGLRSRSALVDFAIHSLDSYSNLRSDDLPSGSEDWTSWLEAESARRTWYTAWLLDAMWKFHFQQRPMLSLETAVVPLPCHEAVWGAQTCADWIAQRSQRPGVGSLLSALQDLYVEKKLENSMGEFSRTIVVHGLFRRSWEVEAYYRQPLSQWEPTAEKQSAASLGPPVPRWLPSILSFRRWRNSACDCLDVLHWSANATIGTNANMEHPTVMHLHFARVILLAPYENILTLAKLRGRGGTDEAAQVARESHVIALWAMRDQYKARLAIVHSGVLLWHVRRYSAAAYYEAPSVLLATLTLWAYATFATQSVPRSVQQSAEAIIDELQATHPDDVDMLPLIHLDRPTDDELVQLFIRQGGSMHANLSGVGDIRGPESPRRILNAGRKLLVEIRNWDISSKCVRVLDDLLVQGA